MMEYTNYLYIIAGLILILGYLRYKKQYISLDIFVFRFLFIASFVYSLALAPTIYNEFSIFYQIILSIAGVVVSLAIVRVNWPKIKEAAERKEEDSKNKK